MNHDDDGIRDEDLALFREAVAGTRRLRDDRANPRPTPPPPRARFRRADESAVLEASLSADPHELVETGEDLSFARPGLDRDILKRLRRGRIPVREALDLHGMNWRLARECVTAFLAECHQRDIHCVRIIHGKGLRSGNTGPVLKGKLNSWLRKREDVLAFCSARPDDGGTGAVYVLLARLAG